MCWCQPASSFTCEAGCCWAQASWWIWVLTFSPHLKLLLLDMDCTSPHLLYQPTYSYSTRMPFFRFDLMSLLALRWPCCCDSFASLCSSHMMKHPEEIGSGCRCGSVETFCATLNTRCHQLPWAHLWWDGQLRMIKKGSWLMLRRRVTWFGLPSPGTELWGPWFIMNQISQKSPWNVAAHCCRILCKFVNMFAASVCFSRSTMPMDVHDSFGDCLEARRIASATSLDVGIICQCQFMLPSCANALSLCVRRPMKMWLRQHVAFWRTGVLSFASFIHLLVKRPRRRWT